MSEPGISNWVKNYPSMNQLREIAADRGVSVEYLISGGASAHAQFSRLIRLLGEAHETVLQNANPDELQVWLEKLREWESVSGDVLRACKGGSHRSKAAEEKGAG